jgi:hypothetical protein
MFAIRDDRSGPPRRAALAAFATTLLVVVSAVAVLSVPSARGAVSTAPAARVAAPTPRIASTPGTVVGVATAPGGGGWLAYSNGAASPFGGAPTLQTGLLALNRPVVGTTADPDGAGYWLVASDGGVFSFGSAAFHGSTGAIHLNQPIVGMASTPDGHGYWLVASDGGVFSFGDAGFHGSTGAIHLNKPIVGMATTPDGHGYWLVASDGGVFSFGDAGFHGSTGAIHLNKPIVGMATTPDGHGYWLVASDGGVFSFGDARFDGSAAALGAVVVGVAPSSNGYTLASNRGPLVYTGAGADPSAAAANPGPGGTPTTTPTTSPTTNPQPSSTFHGVYEYASANSSVDADAADPDLAGVVLDYYWSQIETTKGVYDWSVITNAMAPWVANGKKVILRLATAGQPGWDAPYSGSGTPSWVYTDGARSVSDNTGETVPVYWDSAYLSDLSTFVAAYAAEFDGNPNVALIEAGVGMGGETKPETNLSADGLADWEGVGYTPSTWLATVETISNDYRQDFTRTPVYALLTSTFLQSGGVNWTDYQALATWYTTAPAWGLQNDALSATSSLPDPGAWAGASGLVLEQAQSTTVSGDSLAADAANALSQHAGYLLIYRSDIDNPANSATLAQLASSSSP